ncbi:MAG: hypothetical protein ABH871_02640 [Pseudomonadota bacterium]
MRSSFIIKCALVIMLALCTGACGYSVGRDGEGEGITVTLSPADGTTEQPVDVDVTAEFGDTIEQPISWYDVFSLKKGGAGDNLCTDITYSTESKIATCHHDDLDVDTSYETRLSGVLQTNGKIVIFSTAQ